MALSSVFASLFLTLFKGAVGLLTGSLGILSEAAHSALDLGAALLTFFAVRVGDKPADKDHPYGHTKVESVSALIETGLLFITCVWIFYEAIQRLFFENVEVTVTWYAFAVVVLSIGVDISRSRALKKVANETNSQALEADALHFSSDIWSSTAVLIGLIFTKFNFGIADSIASIVVALFTAYAGWRLGKRTIDILIDTAPEGLTERIKEITEKVVGVVGIEKIRVRPAGSFVFVDMRIQVSRKLPMGKIKIICKNVEDEIQKSIKEADITIHAVPISLKTETIVEQIHLMALDQGLEVHDIAIHTLGNKKYIHFDLEVEAGFNLEEAHQTASILEQSIQEELGGEIEINTHIEPFKPHAVGGKKINAKEEEKITKQLLTIAKTIPEILDIHDIKIREVERKIFISLHADFPAKTSLKKAHDGTGRLEYLARTQMPNIERVVVHAEPLPTPSSLKT